ncbi:MAG: FtsQ-type POTRA domain-containing protein [Chloroflexota bacterium]
MTASGRAGLRGRTRAERVRSRRIVEERVVEPAPRERLPRARRVRRPKRRYDMMLPAELGAEVRLPSLPVIRPGIRLLTAVLLAAAAWAMQHVLTASAFEVQDATVIGARLLTPGQVRSIARVDGEPVVAVDPAEVVRRLLEYPEVGSAEVVVRWPNRVEITIIERYPLAEWDDAGRSWWLSAEGIAFLRRGDWPGVVHLESDEPMLAIGEDPLAPVISPQVLQAAAVLASQLPEVTVFHADSRHGFGFEDPQGWTAYFGLDGDMVMKVRLYHFLSEYLRSKGLRPAVVSVADVAAPYYSMQRDNP